jgi:hypothetical protein
MLHTDKKLLKEFRKGDTAAFEQVYHLYVDLVRKFLYEATMANVLFKTTFFPLLAIWFSKK